MRQSSAIKSALVKTVTYIFIPFCIIFYYVSAYRATLAEMFKY